MKCKVKGIRVINTILCDVLGFSLLVCSGFAWGEIIVDNKFNGHERPVLPNKGTMTIDQSLGQIRGGNLFHSFKVFDINKGQTAIFTDSGNHAINNVVSRVTGDGISHINGKLESQVGHAAFYFINPNGIVFGEGAKVDVTGAFHVSTADAINFMDKKIFSARHLGNASTLTASEPKSFGFLGNSQNKNGTIRFNNTNIKSFNTISQKNQKNYFSAGNIIIDTGSVIKNSSGEIYLDAVGNIKYNVNIKSNKFFNLEKNPYKGNLYIKDKSTIDVSGDGGGLITVQAGNLSINNGSVLKAQNVGGTNAVNKVIYTVNKGIYIGVSNAVNIVGGGQIKTSSYSTGSSGNVEIYSKKLNISGYKKDNKKSDVVESGVFSEVGCENACDGWSNGGNINIKSGAITIVDSGVISSSSYGKTKNAGKIDIESKNITIDGKNQEAGNTTGISSNACINVSSSCNNGNANAGHIFINSNEINIRNNASISTTTSNINGNSGEIIINDKPEYSHHGIVQLTNSKIITSAKNNDGGNIWIGGNGLVLNGGIIQANANTGNNNGGKIKINTTTLLVSHGQLKLGGAKSDNFPKGFNLIQAVSEKGETGTVNSTRPELNINGAMLKLKSNLLPAPDLNATPCKTSQGSSLVQAGYGGLPHKPSDGVYIPNQSVTDRKSGMDVHTVIKGNNTTVGCSPE